MDHVYAKIKRLQKEPLRRVVSDGRLFEVPQIYAESRLAFDPSTLLGEGEWFRVGEFSGRDFFPDFLVDGIASTDVSDLTADRFASISLLVSAQDDRYLFQRVRPTSLLRRKIISLGDVARLEETASRILVNLVPDAFYEPETDELVFRDLSAVSPIFPGVDSLYREATAQQVGEFLGQDFIAAEGLSVESVSKPNRKRIALAIATLGKLSSSERQGIFDYIRDYCSSQLHVDEGAHTITISNDEDLKLLIYGIEQRFYTTLIGDERRLANSIVAM